MDYLPPVACVELSADRFYICLIDVNGAADLPRQLGGWTVERDDRELLQRLLSGRLVVKTTDDPMPEVDQAEVAGYFTVDDTVSKVEAEIAELKNRFTAVLESPERQGLGALTEPRWPDLASLTTRTPNPQSSREGQGRAAFTLGVTVKDLATGWASWNRFASPRPTHCLETQDCRRVTLDSSGTTSTTIPVRMLGPCR